MLNRHQIERIRKDAEGEVEIRKATEALMREFAEHLGRAVATFLACTPYAQWPTFCKAAFEHSKLRAPIAAQLYKDHLPKE